MAMRRMSEIYEMWSIFRVTDVLLPLLAMNGYRVVSRRASSASRISYSTLRWTAARRSNWLRARPGCAWI